MTNPWRDPARAARFRAGNIPWNPTRERQLDVIVDRVAAARPRRILDAGCGPGFVAERLHAALPDAEIHAFDFAPAMTARARERIGAYARVFEAALDGDWGAADFDAVLAVQAVHHLDAAGKRRALRNAFSSLAPGGLYVQSDPVAVADEDFPEFVALTNAARAAAGFPPLPEDFGPAAFRERLAANGDLLDSLEDQLRWLREAGFSGVACYWRHANRAIFGGCRTASCSSTSPPA